MADAGHSAFMSLVFEILELAYAGLPYDTDEELAAGKRWIAALDADGVTRKNITMYLMRTLVDIASNGTD